MFQEFVKVGYTYYLARIDRNSQPGLNSTCVTLPNGQGYKLTHPGVCPPHFCTPTGEVGHLHR